MTELDLYKIINGNSIEYHWEIDQNGVKDVIIFPDFDDMKKFNDLMSPSIFEDEGIECYWKDGYVAVWMQYICDHFDINIESVFEKKHNR